MTEQKDLRTRMLDSAKDAGADYAYYARKEDENLSRDDVAQALADKVVRPDEIAAAFLKGADIPWNAGADITAGGIAANEVEERETLPDDASAVQRATSALDLIVRYGGIDGDHHKTWVLDQVVRRLTGSAYEEFVAWARSDGHDPDAYNWDTGIAP